MVRDIGFSLRKGEILEFAGLMGAGRTAFKSWGWLLWASLLLILAVGTAFGYLNGILVSRLKLPPFIATLGTMMISMGVGSIVANVRIATFPTRASADGWFKSIYKLIGEDGFSIPTGAIVLFGVAVIAWIILTKTKMGRYIFSIGSNKEAARLSGVVVIGAVLVDIYRNEKASEVKIPKGEKIILDK